MDPERQVCCPNCGHEWAEDDDADPPYAVIPSRLDSTTGTIWQLVDGDWVDTGRVPDAITRWAYALRPSATPLLSTMTTASPAHTTVEWGWGSPE